MSDVDNKEGWIPTPEDNEASQREIEKSRAAAFEAISAEPAINYEPVHRLGVIFGYATPRQSPIQERQEPPRASEGPVPLPKATPKPPTLWERMIFHVDAFFGIIPESRRYNDARETSGGSGRGMGQEADAGKQDERNGQ